MLRFMQTSLLPAFASLLLVSQAQAETASTTSNLPQPNPPRVDNPQSAERSTPKPTELQGSRSSVNTVKQSNQPKADEVSERDRIILQYQLQRIIPAEPQR